MKTKRKALTLALCAVLLVVTSVLGTLAYLTDHESVVNTFSVGQVHIKLDEAAVNKDGSFVTDAKNRTPDGNEYHLLPGHTYYKDPTVTIKIGSEDCYVRMFVAFNCSDVLDEVFPKADLLSIFGEYNESEWMYVGNVEDKDANTRTYEFRYVGKASKDGVIPKNEDSATKLPYLFKSFTVPGSVTNEQIKKLEDLEISVTAEAIQADGFANADAAWTAFTK